MAVALALVVLVGIVIGGIVVIRRIAGKRQEGTGQGGDVLVYLLLALAVGVTGFALASLAATAFPSDDFVVDVSGRVANSLAALVVATPVAFFLWRRQQKRRATYPASTGWTVYLALIEAVFMTALVIAVIDLFEWIFTNASGAAWTSIIVFGGIVVLHELAARRTPPASQGAGLPRVVGSAIGLVTAVTGLGGVIGWLLDEVYATLVPTAGGSDLGTWVSFLLAGVPVWYYRWLRPWPGEPKTPRNVWMSLVSVAGLSAAVGALTLILARTATYLLTRTDAAGTHFEFLPSSLTVSIVGFSVWAHHRQRLGPERTNPVRSYEYAMMALGLVTTVGGATALSTAALGPQDLVGRGADDIVAVVITLLVGAIVWLYFWTRASALPRATEAASRPRRVYLIGLSVVLGLASAGALIATLVIVFQRLLGEQDGSSVVFQLSLFVFAALATWHLLRVNGEDRELIGSDETLAPFSVTVVCSDAGTIPSAFPDAANVRVVYRQDGEGVIDAAMAGEIVEAVGHRSSYVWVDADGYRIAFVR